MVINNDIAGGEIITFVLQSQSLYRAGQFSAFEKCVHDKIRQLTRQKNRESLKKLYWYMDPLYQLFYSEIESKSTPLSGHFQKMLELAAKPLFRLSELTRTSYLVELEKMID